MNMAKLGPSKKSCATNNKLVKCLNALKMLTDN